MIESMKDLSLHRIEELKALAVYLFQERVFECRYRQRLEVE